VAVSTTASTVSIAEANLTIANLGDRIVDAGDIFMYWRMVKLRVYQYLQAGSSATLEKYGTDYIHGIGFIPISNSMYTAPVSIAQIVDFPEFKQVGGNARAGISVGKSGLIGSMMTKWLTTNATSTPDLQSAGVVTVFSISGPLADTNQANVRQILEYEVEFKGPVDTALIPNFHSKEKKRPVVTNCRPNRITEIGPDGQVTILRDEVSVVNVLSEDYVSEWKTPSEVGREEKALLRLGNPVSAPPPRRRV